MPTTTPRPGSARPLVGGVRALRRGKHVVDEEACAQQAVLYLVAAGQPRDRRDPPRRPSYAPRSRWPERRRLLCDLSHLDLSAEPRLPRCALEEAVSGLETASLNLEVLYPKAHESEAGHALVMIG